MPRQERSRFLKKSNIADEVEALLRPVIEELGYGIWDVVYRKVGADWVLTVTIDHPQGISIDDCEKVHRRIDPILDEADPIDNPYMLEVSSPGIEREIRTDAHILACLGAEIEARLFAPLSGKRVFTGRLLAFSDGTLTLACGEETVKIPRASIARMHTLYRESDSPADDPQTPPPASDQQKG